MAALLLTLDLHIHNWILGKGNYGCLFFVEVNVKLLMTTLKLLEGLSEDERAQLNAKLADHLRLCRKNGAPLDSLDRFVVEGIEVMRLEARLTSPNAVDAGYEGPRFSYPQYVSPRGDY